MSITSCDERNNEEIITETRFERLNLDLECKNCANTELTAPRTNEYEQQSLNPDCDSKVLSFKTRKQRTSCSTERDVRYLREGAQPQRKAVVDAALRHVDVLARAVLVKAAHVGVGQAGQPHDGVDLASVSVTWTWSTEVDYERWQLNTARLIEGRLLHAKSTARAVATETFVLANQNVTKDGKMHTIYAEKFSRQKVYLSDTIEVWRIRNLNFRKQIINFRKDNRACIVSTPNAQRYAQRTWQHELNAVLRIQRHFRRPRLMSHENRRVGGVASLVSVGQFHAMISVASQMNKDRKLLSEEVSVVFEVIKGIHLEGIIRDKAVKDIRNKSSVLNMQVGKISSFRTQNEAMTKISQLCTSELRLKQKWLEYVIYFSGFFRWFFGHLPNFFLHDRKHQVNLAIKPFSVIKNVL